MVLGGSLWFAVRARARFPRPARGRLSGGHQQKGVVRMGSASAKPTTRQALCDTWDLWVQTLRANGELFYRFRDFLAVFGVLHCPT